MLNKVEVTNVTLEGTQGVKLNVYFRKTGHIVYVKTNIIVPADISAGSQIFAIDDVIPEFAKTNEHFVETGLKLCCFSDSYSSEKFKTSIYVTPEQEKYYRLAYSFTRSDTTQDVTLESFMSYIVDEEVVTENDYTLGDVNLDGKVNIDDQLLIIDYIMNEVSLTDKQFKAADMNKDGKVSSTDYGILGDKIVEHRWCCRPKRLRFIK